MRPAMHHRWRFYGRRPRRTTAFSLIEVVVALGIFSVGIAVVLRLFAGIADSIRLAGETEAGVHAAEALIGRLRAGPFWDVAGDMMTPEELRRLDASGRKGSLTDHRLFFANPTADRIGKDGDALWLGHEGEKYFEIALVRDETRSPLGEDELASSLVFTARIRWPASANVGAHRMVLAGSVFRGP